MKRIVGLFMLAFFELYVPQVRANIVGLDLQNFNPAASSMDGVTVSNTLTLGQGRWGLGVFVNYASNTLPYFRSDDGKTRDEQKKFNDSLTSLDLQVSYGLTSFWDLQATLPYVIGQQIGEENEVHGYYENKGLTGYRFGSKLRLLQAGPLALGVLGNATYNRVEDNPYSGDSRWPNASLELVSSLNFGQLLLTANAGYRWRFTKEARKIAELLPIEEYGDQFIYSVGTVLPFSSQWALTGEIYGAANRDDFSDDSARSTTIAEALAGLRYEPIPEIQLHAGFGGELRHSVSSADARVYSGVRWTLGKTKVAAEPVLAPAPIAPMLVKSEPNLEDAVIDLDDVYFNFDSVVIRDRSGFTVLEKLNTLMQQHHNIERVLIEGHTCDLGSEPYNQKLSDRRALAIEHWLRDRYGISSSKLHSVGWGEVQPKFENYSQKNRRLNRRVSFKIFFEKSVAGAEAVSGTSGGH